MTGLFLFALLSSFALTPLARRYAISSGLVDLPDARRVHQQPVARGGGIAMIVVFLLAVALAPWVPGMQGHLQLPGMAGAFIALLAGLGFWDDHQSIPSRWRALVQVLATLALLWSVKGSLPMDSSTLWLVLPATVIVVWWINLFNFMDGSDGVAGVQTLFMGAGVGLLSFQSAGSLSALGPAGICGFLSAAVALGFLPWNFPNARVFMGDVGSYGLASILAVTAILGLADGTLSFLAVMLLPAVFVVDASATLISRIARGQRWYDGHREHLYQRLAMGRAGSTGVVLGLAVVNALFIWPALSLLREKPEYSHMIVISVYLILILCWWLGGRQLDRGQAR